MTQDWHGDEEAELRQRLQQVQSEHADLLDKTMGLTSIGNPELVGRAKDLEKEADELRIRLGQEPRFPPEPSGRKQASGWLLLGGAVIFIVLVLVLTTPR